MVDCDELDLVLCACGVGVGFDEYVAAGTAACAALRAYERWGGEERGCESLRVDLGRVLRGRGRPGPACAFKLRDCSFFMGTVNDVESFGGVETFTHKGGLSAGSFAIGPLTCVYTHDACEAGG